MAEDSRISKSPRAICASGRPIIIPKGCCSQSTRWDLWWYIQSWAATEFPSLSVSVSIASASEGSWANHYQDSNGPPRALITEWEFPPAVVVRWQADLPARFPFGETTLWVGMGSSSILKPPWLAACWTSLCWVLLAFIVWSWPDWGDLPTQGGDLHKLNLLYWSVLSLSHSFLLWWGWLGGTQ